MRDLSLSKRSFLSLPAKYGASQRLPVKCNTLCKQKLVEQFFGGIGLKQENGRAHCILHVSGVKECVSLRACVEKALEVLIYGLVVAFRVSHTLST